jgi:hypothetical protein
MRSRFRLPEIWVSAIPPLLTMFVSGLWHGAGWTFVVWGVYYGVLITAYQWIGIRGDWKPASPWRRGLAWVIMFTFIVFGWTIFRAPSLAWLGQIIFHGEFIGARADLVVALITFSIAFFYALPLLVKWRLDQQPKQGWLQAGYLAAATALIIIYLNSSFRISFISVLTRCAFASIFADPFSHPRVERDSIAGVMSAFPREPGPRFDLGPAALPRPSILTCQT